MSVNYKKLWKLMIDKNLSKTELTHFAGISTNAMAKLGRNEDVRVNVLEKLCTLYLQLEGYGCRGWVEWEEVNLQDQLADANARLVGLQADQLEHTLEEQEEAYGRESDP